MRSTRQTESAKIHPTRPVSVPEGSSRESDTDRESRANRGSRRRPLESAAINPELKPRLQSAGQGAPRRGRQKGVHASCLAKGWKRHRPEGKDLCRHSHRAYRIDQRLRVTVGSRRNSEPGQFGNADAYGRWNSARNAARCAKPTPAKGCRTRQNGRRESRTVERAQAFAKAAQLKVRSQASLSPLGRTCRAPGAPKHPGELTVS